jgi:hypothetical protein
VKVGDPLADNPFVHLPQFTWEVTGAELLPSGGAVRPELGGAERLNAIERLTDEPLPADVAGSIEVAPRNAPFGHRPVYFFGRQRNDSKVWSSAQLITFV